jgi:hypothetical protein
VGELVEDGEVEEERFEDGSLDDGLKFFDTRITTF